MHCMQDKPASDSMSAALDLMHMGGLTRQAVKLVKGLEIKQDEANFTMAVFSVIGWFKVRTTRARMQRVRAGTLL